MQRKSNKKFSVSVGLPNDKADIIYVHANKLYRSVSSTVRFIVEEYIEKNQLETKYAKELKAMRESN